jgi:hypothetical protein
MLILRQAYHYLVQEDKMTKGDGSLIIWIAILNIITVQTRDSERLFSRLQPPAEHAP